MSNDLKQGDRVRVKNDGDGADGVTGTIRKVFRSGRCMVYLDNGDIRNLSQIEMEKIVDRDAC